MSVEIGFALELFAALRDCAWMRILALRVVRFQVRLPVITPFEELPANLAFMSGLFGRGPLALLFDSANAWQDWGVVIGRSAHAFSIVEVNGIPRSLRSRPIYCCCSIDIVRWWASRRNTVRVW